MAIPDPERERTLPYAIVLSLFIATSFFAVLGLAPLFDVDEGAFSEATREMLLSGNLLTTYLNGEPRFDKPILIYWLQLISVKSFGLNEFALRLPSALAGGLWAAALFGWARRQSGVRQAFVAAAMLVLSLQVSIIAKAAIADALLNLFLAVTMLALLEHVKTESRPALLLAFASAGFGMLTKGPIALLIPLGTTFLYLLLRGEPARFFRMVFNPLGILLFLGIALPWYVLEYLDQGEAFIEGFFLKHNVGRFNTSLEGHSGSLFYYFPVVIIGLMPFTGLLSTIIGNLKALAAEEENRFLFIWFLFVFVFFSFSGTKLPHYMIYGYTPLFVLMARVLPLVRRPGLLVLWPLLLLALLALLPLLLPALAEDAPNAYVAAVLEAARGLMGPLHLGATLLTMLLMALAALPPRLPILARLFLPALLFSLYLNLHVMPLAGRLMQEPVKEAALLARREGWKIVMWKVDYPSFLVYSQSLVEKRPPRAGEIVLTTVKYLERLDSPELLFSRNGIVLAKLPE